MNMKNLVQVIVTVSNQISTDTEVLHPRAFRISSPNCATIEFLIKIKYR